MILVDVLVTGEKETLIAWLDFRKEMGYGINFVPTFTTSCLSFN